MAWGHSQLKGLQELRNLKAVRERREKTLRELSAETGASLSTLSLLENGKRRARPETINRIADALEVPNRELLRADWDSLDQNQQNQEVQQMLDLVDTATFCPDRTLKFMSHTILYEMFHRGIRWPSVEELKAFDQGHQGRLFENGSK